MGATSDGLQTRPPTPSSERQFTTLCSNQSEICPMGRYSLKSFTQISNRQLGSFPAVRLLYAERFHRTNFSCCCLSLQSGSHLKVLHVYDVCKSGLYSRCSAEASTHTLKKALSIAAGDRYTLRHHPRHPPPDRCCADSTTKRLSYPLGRVDRITTWSARAK